MADQTEQSLYEESFYAEIATRIRDLEDRQRISRDRLILIGKNVLEMREKINQEIIDIKKAVEDMRIEMRRIKDFIRNISYETENFARKNELVILSKQAKMFQPLDLVTKQEVRGIIQEEIKKITSA